MHWFLVLTWSGILSLGQINSSIVDLINGAKKYFYLTFFYLQSPTAASVNSDELNFSVLCHVLAD